MGSALVSGLLSSGWAASSLVVVEPQASRRSGLAKSHPGLRVQASPEPGMLSASGGAVLAVKQDAAEAACKSALAAGGMRLVSVIAGVTCERLEAWTPKGTPVIRAVPNTPALIRAGVTAIAAGRGASEVDLEWAEGVLGAVGRVLRLPERQLDAVTGLSGSGPAYFFLVAEALVDAGVLAGLAPDISQVLVTETLRGAAALLERRTDSPGALRAMVTSPGGTTAAGLRVLESRAVRSAFLEAVAAATERSRELGHALR